MNTILRMAFIASSLVLMLMADVPLLPVPLVPEAHAILGVRRRTAVVVGAAVHAADSAQMAQAQQQTAMAQQQAAAAQQETAIAQQQRRRCSRRETVAAGHRRCHPPRRLHRHAGRRCGVLLLWRQLLPRGIPGKSARLCDGEAVTQP